MSDSVQPHRQQPTRLPRPWDSPGKNTGVGCHFLLQGMKVKSEREVAQLCPRLLATPWTAAHQAPPSMGFSRQEYWSGLPLPSPRGRARSNKHDCHKCGWSLLAGSLLSLYIEHWHQKEHKTVLVLTVVQIISQLGQNKT